MFSRPADELNDPFDRLEREMLAFVLHVESSARQSTMFQRMERAAYRIARVLDARGPATVVDIARALELDASTVTRQVAAMEARQQATRRVHSGDRRAWEIHLTAAGRGEMEAITELGRRRFAVWLEGWRPEDVERFALLLERFNMAIAPPADATYA